jgi:hypothetical protein
LGIEEEANQGTNPSLSVYFLAFAGLLCGVLFDPEDGGSVLPQNISALLLNWITVFFIDIAVRDRLCVV